MARQGQARPDEARRGGAQTRRCPLVLKNTVCLVSIWNDCYKSCLAYCHAVWQLLNPVKFIKENMRKKNIWKVMPIPMICLVSGYRKMIVEEIMKILSFPEPEILRVKIGSTVSCLDIFERVSNILEIFLPVRHVFQFGYRTLYRLRFWMYLYWNGPFLRINILLTHWGQVTHICVGNLTIIGPDNGLSLGRCQAIIWTNAEILLIGPRGTNFSEILIGIHKFSFKKIHLKMSSAKWLPFCFGLNVSTNGIFQMKVTTALWMDWTLSTFHHDIAYCIAFRCRIVPPSTTTKLLVCAPFYIHPVHWHSNGRAWNTRCLPAEIITNVWNGFLSLGQVIVLWNPCRIFGVQIEDRQLYLYW